MCSKEIPRETEGDLIFVVTATGTLDEARKLADDLVGRKLAGCVSISSPVRSVYRWRDQIQREEEFLLFIKTLKANYPGVESFIKENHSYELPEILSIPVGRFEAKYGNWLRDHSRPPEEKHR